MQPADKQRLYLLADGEKLLEDTAKLADAGVENDQELAVTFQTEGDTDHICRKVSASACTAPNQIASCA